MLVFDKTFGSIVNAKLWDAYSKLPLRNAKVNDFAPELINGWTKNPWITLILWDAGITFDIDGKFNVKEVEFAESTVNVKALNKIWTVLEANKEKNASFGLTAEMISLSPVAIGVGAKKSKINYVDTPTVNWTKGLTPAMDLTVTGLMMHVILSISE